MQFGQLKRREFITLLGGAAAAWPLVARAQQPERMRRIGVLISGAEADPELQARITVFRQTLETLGWWEGRTVHSQYRFAGGKPEHAPSLAAELVAAQPDVILVQSTPNTAAVQRQTRTIPIVFNLVSDPIGSGFVASLARPGGNLTGLMLYEASVAGKWLTMLKEIAPQVSRAALVHNPKTTTFYLHAAEALAPSLGIELVPIPFETAADIAGGIESFAPRSNGGLILTPDFASVANRDLIVALAARHRLPAVYSSRDFVLAGGLMSYHTGLEYQFREAATYVDRILRGAKPADLPVQAPTKYETVLNLKTAKMLGLTVPPGLLVAADEVIE
jgi:putative ABC transport system substrate-binding protein